MRREHKDDDQRLTGKKRGAVCARCLLVCVCVCALVSLCEIRGGPRGRVFTRAALFGFHCV